jgi:hypothetical protein
MNFEDLSNNNWNSRKDAALAMDCTNPSPPPPPFLPVAGAITKGAGDELGIKRGPKNSHDQFFNTDSQQHMSACTSIGVFMTACPSEQYRHKSHILFWSPVTATWPFIIDAWRCKGQIWFRQIMLYTLRPWLLLITRMTARFGLKIHLQCKNVLYHFSSKDFPQTHMWINVCYMKDMGLGVGRWGLQDGRSGGWNSEVGGWVRSSF